MSPRRNTILSTASTESKSTKALPLKAYETGYTKATQAAIHHENRVECENGAPECLCA